jgi:hypothetical protein
MPLGSSCSSQNLDMEDRQLPQVEQLSGRLTGELVLPAERLRGTSDAPRSQQRTTSRHRSKRCARRSSGASSSRSRGKWLALAAVARVRLVGQELLAS